MHLVHGGVLAHVGDSLLEVLGVARNPLAAIAALGDGVKLLESRGFRTSGDKHLMGQSWPASGYTDLQEAGRHGHGRKTFQYGKPVPK